MGNREDIAPIVPSARAPLVRVPLVRAPLVRVPLVRVPLVKALLVLVGADSPTASNPGGDTIKSPHHEHTKWDFSPDDFKRSTGLESCLGGIGRP